MPEQICVAEIEVLGCPPATGRGRFRKVFTRQESTRFIITTLRDQDGDPVPAASIDSIVVTIVETATGAIVNDRDAQDVLNANGGTMHPTSGVFDFQITPADTAIVNPATPAGSLDLHAALRDGSIEDHLATFTLTWGEDRKDHFEVLVRVLNQRNIPHGGE